ncbi:hypothetical protein RB195_000793 [Necator americanus]|uniref:N-acetyltransferase domain-containing protein n=1 Tax=Necator americanus TaxID=51031 RepID=A0ABR1DBE0_NECAM
MKLQHPWIVALSLLFALESVTPIVLKCSHLKLMKTTTLRPYVSTTTVRFPSTPRLPVVCAALFPISNNNFTCLKYVGGYAWKTPFLCVCSGMSCVYEGELLKALSNIEQKTVYGTTTDESYVRELGQCIIDRIKKRRETHTTTEDFQNEDSEVDASHPLLSWYTRVIESDDDDDDEYCSRDESVDIVLLAAFLYITKKENPLEPFKDVLKRQKPETPGLPYEMKVFSNNLPKSVGNPWIGAYSKHGFWYKFHEGDKSDFDKLVALSSEQNSYMLNYDYVNAWEKAYGKMNVRIVVAKNLKREVMGGVVAIKKKDYTQIGTYFVMEEYRHSGIGSMLFKELLRGNEGVFQAMHHLLPTVERFGLDKCTGRRLNHIKIENPDGFPDLQENLSDGRVVSSDEFTPGNWHSVTIFDREASGEMRPIRELLALEDSATVAIFNNQDVCLGFGMSRELVGEGVRRILVGPLYATSQLFAEVITKAILNKYYNPQWDFDFNPDCFAIYRRSVEFLLPVEERMLPVILKLNGEEGKLSRERMWYQTCSSKKLPDARLDMVYVAGDLHSALV